MLVHLYGTVKMNVARASSGSRGDAYLKIAVDRDSAKARQIKTDARESTGAGSLQANSEPLCRDGMNPFVVSFEG